MPIFEDLPWTLDDARRHDEAAKRRARGVRLPDRVLERMREDAEKARAKDRKRAKRKKAPGVRS